MISSHVMTWWLIFSPLAILVAVIWRRSGPRVALGTGVLLSFLLPNWIVLDVAGHPLDFRLAISCFGLVLYCFHPQATFRTKLIISDWAMFGLALIQFLSDCWTQDFQLVLLLKSYVEWIVPYFAGRQAVQSAADLVPLKKVACGVAIVLGLWSICESFTHFNPIHAAVSERPDDRMNKHAVRWGIQRAEGPTTHPIWNAMLQVMLLPWTLRSAVSGWKRRQYWLSLLPVISIAGVLCTTSRGPVLVIVGILFGIAACHWPGARKYLFGGLFAVSVLAFAFSEPIIELLQEASQESEQYKGHELEIDGKMVPYTTTKHRILLLQVYRSAMLRAGITGFGSDATTGFPVRIPYGLMHPETMQAFWTIDNQYVLTQLRSGFLAVACLTAFLAAAGVYSISTSLKRQGGEAVFFSSLGSALISVLLFFTIEWMHIDYGFAVIWSAGISAGCRAHRGLRQFDEDRKLRHSSHGEVSRRDQSSGRPARNG